ncbi:response regulator [Rhodobium gokarnense]|uniref:Two-component system torCAD operon response regulator TorR n=1 Tax=Rhodobium gokarnense TaxID=364296 RepID=A0ABT3H6T8_9HYPH|nr:response regulator [Rhodobium gokarnense]MCW2306107.1 two-component system torCAD operon response regulator TorR [Rhodobium gokarnense]
MDDRQHVLIVEDELSTRTMLSAYFSKEGFRVSTAESGDQMWAVFARDTVDLVLLDVRLPGKDGLTLTREIRDRSDVGIIIVTSQADEVDQIIGLETGADHYVTKPYNPRDLLARARTVLRRTRAPAPQATQEEVRHFEGWCVNFGQRRVRNPNGCEVKLTRAEFELLAAFLRNPQTVLTRDALLGGVSHREWAPNDRSVDVLVGRLRKKIESDPNDPRIVLTEHGVGYRFAANVT